MTYMKKHTHTEREREREKVGDKERTNDLGEKKYLSEQQLLVFS